MIVNCKHFYPLNVFIRTAVCQIVNAMKIPHDHHFVLHDTHKLPQQKTHTFKGKDETFYV